MSEAAFDTNILIDALNNAGGATVELTRYDRLFISRIAWIEVLTGALPGDGIRAEGFMSYFTIIEVDERIARRAATLRSGRSRLKLADSIILATAQDRGHILVTRNTRDFPLDMPGIRVPYTL